MEDHAEERLRRHSAQQEALANLSSEALSGRPIDDIASDAVRMIAQVLDVRGASIWLVGRDGSIALAASRGEVLFDEEVIRSRIASTHSSIRDRSALFTFGGAAGTAGTLGVTGSRRLRADEVHFLSAVANLLAQAITRDRNEEELRTRAAQQVAIAQFGRFALLGITPELLEHLCEVVQKILEADYVTFLSYQRETNTFTRGAGSWWVSENTEVPADASTLSGYTALHGGPTIVADYATESRFVSHQGFAEAGFVSGMAAEVRGERNLYGVLTVQSRRRRNFGDADARFLQALANAAAEAMERDAAQRALVESEARYRDQLDQANRLTSLGRLAATIAHEFNNVLMGISPFVELLRRSDIAYERRLSALDHMASSIQRGRRITEEILRFTSPPEPVFEPVPLWQWSQAIAQELRSMLGLQYQVNVEVEDRTVSAYADIGQLHQIISNLVINARDAMPNGGGITLRMRRESPGTRFDFGVVPQVENFVHFEIADEGTGMTAETKRHIFEPLFTTKRHGTGLGLAITHQVVRRHGGMIFVESEPGAGTRFHIFLPAANSNVPKRSRETPPAAVAPDPCRVLLVEDDPNVATGIALLLQEEGFIVDVVNLGAEALGAVERTSPDVVVLDIGLPDIDGRKVYELIAAEHPDLPVIFSTGHGDERKIEPYLSRGNVSMLLKPYEISILLAAIRRLTA